MGVVRISALLTLTLLSVSAFEHEQALAQGAPPKPALAVAPIFGQLVLTGHPQGFGFGPAFEKTQPQTYIREHVLAGETLDDWSQMITVTGFRDAAKPDTPPKAVVGNMAGGFKRACPDSFGAEAVLDDKLAGGFEIFAAVMSCGVSPTKAGKTSETALIIAIKGKADVYTIQWAEQGPLSKTPLSLDLAKWEERFKKLRPIRLCSIVAGEKAPYASCLAAG